MLERLPRVLLHAGRRAAVVGALVLYVHLDYSLLALVVLFLVPDVSLLGYLAGPRVGAAAYNAIHTTFGADRARNDRGPRRMATSPSRSP